MKRNRDQDSGYDESKLTLSIAPVTLRPSDFSFHVLNVQNSETLTKRFGMGTDGKNVQHGNLEVGADGKECPTR